MKPTPVTIDNNTPLPKFSSAQVYNVSRESIKHTATGPDGIPFCVCGKKTAEKCEEFDALFWHNLFDIFLTNRNLT